MSDKTLEWYNRAMEDMPGLVDVLITAIAKAFLGEPVGLNEATVAMLTDEIYKSMLTAIDEHVKELTSALDAVSVSSAADRAALGRCSNALAVIYNLATDGRFNMDIHTEVDVINAVNGMRSVPDSVLLDAMETGVVMSTRDVRCESHGGYTRAWVATYDVDHHAEAHTARALLRQIIRNRQLASAKTNIGESVDASV